MLEALGLRNVEVVPRIIDLNTGIQITRQQFGNAYFDEVACRDGINRLDNYKKKWNSRDGRWSDEPSKSNGCSEGADAFRQWAQAKNGGLITMAGATPQSRGERPAPDWRL